MKVRKISAVLIVLALLTSCTPLYSHSVAIPQAAQTAETPADNESKARQTIKKLLKNCSQKYKSIKKCL